MNSKYNGIPAPLKLISYLSQHKGNYSFLIGIPQQGHNYTLSLDAIANLDASFFNRKC